MSVAPIRFRHGILPLLAYPRGQGLRQAFSIAEGYDLALIAAVRVTIAPRRADAAAPWVGSMAADDAFDGRVFTLDFADDALSDDDDELALEDITAERHALWAVDALDAEGALLWRLQGDLRFSSPYGADGGETAAIGSPIELAITDEVTIAVTILGNSEVGGPIEVDNAAVVAAIEEDPAAVRVAAGLGSAALADAGAFETAGAVAALSESLGDAATKDVGVANGVADLDGDGKIPVARMPSIAIVEFLGEVANQSAMLALTGQSGDWVKRTDTGTVWIIVGNNPAQISSWSEISYPAAPVTSVAGLTGAVGASALRSALSLGTAQRAAFAGLDIPYVSLTRPFICGVGSHGLSLLVRDGHNAVFERGDSSPMCIMRFNSGGEFATGRLLLASDGSPYNANCGVFPISAGLLEINSGTLGQRRDLRLRDMTLTPSASLTPAANGDLMIEATSNTSITIKLKGSDGTVRSVSLALS